MYDMKEMQRVIEYAAELVDTEGSLRCTLHTIATIRDLDTIMASREALIDAGFRFSDSYHNLTGYSEIAKFVQWEE